MSEQAKKKSASKCESGLFSKSDIASFLKDGVRHVHSSMLGERDACARTTQQSLDNREDTATYSWELSEEGLKKEILTSESRSEQISHICEELGVKNRRILSDKIKTVLEELITNAIYHAHVNEEGNPRYRRSEQAHLDSESPVIVRFGSIDDGIFLSVEDRGGALEFDRVAQAFERCYARDKQQFEEKEQGAGLGLYVVFETVVHLKIEVVTGKKTTVSCWIPEKSSFDPDHFSFNHFHWKETE